MFRLYRLKDSHHLIPALFDVVRMPKSPGKVSLYNSPRELLTIPLLAQYYSINTTRCSLWSARTLTCSPFLAKGQI